VLVPMTDGELQALFLEAGFAASECIVKWNNFSTFVAYKPIDSPPMPTSMPTSNAKATLADIAVTTPLSAPVAKLTVPGLAGPLDSYFDPDPDYLYTILSHQGVQVWHISAIRGV
jgi:hypothetical protein